MTNEPVQDTGGPSTINKATEAVQAVTNTVRDTTRTLANAIESGRQPGRPLDRLAHWAREAPLQALSVAFLFGVLFGRRRG
ncbi:hypothetical protein ACVIGA_001819 [Bradyrhizobium sp. USDA 3240]|nr:hypothetical protein BraRD5C2_25520 [Bradyrhizobium sp. RD5-C2]